MRKEQPCIFFLLKLPWGRRPKLEEVEWVCIYWFIFSCHSSCTTALSVSEWKDAKPWNFAAGRWHWLNHRNCFMKCRGHGNKPSAPHASCFISAEGWKQHDWGFTTTILWWLQYVSWRRNLHCLFILTDSLLIILFQVLQRMKPRMWDWSSFLVCLTNPVGWQPIKWF